MQHPGFTRLAWILFLAAGCGSSAQPVPGLSDAGAADVEEAPDVWPWGADAAPALPDASPEPDLPALPPDGLPTGACGAESAPLRRLTTTQYQRTVRDLTGLTVTTMFPVPASRDGFDDLVEVQDNGILQVGAWHEAAEAIVAGLADKLSAFTGCATIDDACAQSFVLKFGLRAYRRPLTVAEVDAHLAVFNQVKMLGDASDGILAVLRVMLQSPHFLYRPEISGAVSAGGMIPTPYEVASRLSYFLWGSTPDATLLDFASRAELNSTTQVDAQIRRMLLDPRARQGTNDFIRQWLSVDQVLDVPKDPALYPTWNADLAAAAREEAYRFAQQVIFDEGGRLATLLTSTQGTINAPLAQLYGVTITGTDWQSADLSSQHRLGLLTQGWFLAGRGTIASRGNFVRERLLCQPIPPPPPNVDPQPPQSMPGATNRERYQSQLLNPVCAACHTLFDGIGFTFESYDAIGAFRTIDNGKPIDTSGQIIGSQDVDGMVTDAPALIRRLADSAQVRDCLVDRWRTLAIGREADTADACRVSQLERLFRGGNGNVRDLIAAIALDAARRPRLAAEVSSATGSPLIVMPGDQAKLQKIVLDAVGSQLVQLRQRLVLPIDRAHLDQHQSGLRELEMKLQ
jgi:hypothetical protein